MARRVSQSESEPQPSAASVRAALAGDAAAVRQLVDLLSPVVHARVARAVLRSGARARQGRDVRQGIEDLTQDVFAALFADDGRALRAWDPARGLSLANFVGLVAEHQVASILRSGRRNPWTEEPMLAEDLDAAMTTVDRTERTVHSRELLAALAERLRTVLTPRGLLLFQLLLVEEQSVESVCASAGMTPDAVYAWRSRLGKVVRHFGEELANDFPSDRAPPQRSTKGGLREDESR
jgi:RNA polymerase sigma-70 factor (ECF subfamily)